MATPFSTARDPDLVAALDQFAHLVGHGWQTKLRKAWRSQDFSGFPPEIQVEKLNTIYTQFGTDWLEEREYYVRMTINKHGQIRERLVWRIKNWGWETQAEAEADGFRGVARLTSKEAYRLIEAFKDSGVFGRLGMGHDAIEFRAERIADRPIYVFYLWDEEEGATTPHATVRCDGMWAAQKYFKQQYPDLWQSDYQVRHISRCKDDWQAIGQLQLDHDFIDEQLRSAR